MSLEILCRILHYYAETKIHIFKKLSSKLSPDLYLAMKDSTTIIKLLHDMRCIINSINTNNDNVYSFEFKCCQLHCSWKVDKRHRDLIQKGWIDICKESLCINLSDEEKLLRVSYKDIHALKFNDISNTVQVNII